MANVGRRGGFWHSGNSFAQRRSHRFQRKNADFSREEESAGEYSAIDRMELVDPLKVQRYKRKTWAGTEYNVLNYEEDQVYTPEQNQQREVSYEAVSKWFYIGTLAAAVITLFLLWFMLSNPALMERVFSGSFS